MIHSIRYDEPMADYHADQTFLGRSPFTAFLECPAMYPAYLRKPRDDSYNLGSATHCAWLEREKFKKTYIHIEGPMNRNPFKKQADDAKEAGLIPVGDSDWRKIEGMVNSLDRDPDASALLSKGKQEVSVRWFDDDTGVAMKCRFDTIITEMGIAGDLKTFNSVTERNVQRQIVKMKYELQSAWYLRGASELVGRKITNFVHIFVMTEDPWLVIPYALDDASIERADLDVRDGLKRFAACRDANTWPAPEPGVRSISLPDYRFVYEGEYA